MAIHIPTSARWSSIGLASISYKPLGLLLKSRVRSISSRVELGNIANESREAPSDKLSNNSKRAEAEKSVGSVGTSGQEQVQDHKKKTVAQMDHELMQKMAGIAGDGGESGIEYEDGKPVAMKRGVRENMFRYI